MARTLSRFAKRQVRKAFLLPEELVSVLDRSRARYDINESEMIRFLLFAYALDGGALRGALDRLMPVGQTAAERETMRAVMIERVVAILGEEGAGA